MSREAVIVSAVRTPVAKYGGTLSGLRDYELAGLVINEAVSRIGLDPEMIDDVYFGNAEGMPGDLARIGVLQAELPIRVPGATVDRQCASGLEAIKLAAAMVKSGLGDVYIAGGAESQSTNPWFMEKSARPYSYQPPEFTYVRMAPPKTGDPAMGETAENVLDRYPEITREDMDRFALESHRRALEAIKKGAFAEQIVPVPVKVKRKEILFSQDECPREDTNMEQLASLKPIFRKGGQVTAGNSCPMNDGAAAVVVMSREKADELKLPYLLIVKDFATVGLEPEVMGLGPIYAVQKLLERNKLTLDDIEMIELNEAFASQSLACIRDLRLDMDRVNPNGGAIALGHPLGATGALLTVKLAHAMKGSKRKYGIVTMCIGGGQGAAGLFERP